MAGRGGHDGPVQGTPSEGFAALWDAFRRGSVGTPAGPGPAPPDLDAYLAAHPGIAPAERLALVIYDVRERWRAGVPRSPESYLAVLGADPEPATVAEVVLADYGARRERGEWVDLETYASRFPGLRGRLQGVLGPADLARLAETGEQPLHWTLPAEAPPGLTCPCDAPCGADGLVSTRGAHSGPTNAAFRVATEDACPAAPDPPDPVELADPRDPTGPPRFVILRRLGTGGMGVVYQAFDRVRSASVALKTMKRVDALALYRFKQEFRVLSDLSHPNLVNLFELVGLGDLWFFTMELVPGRDFVTFVRRGPDDGACDGEGSDADRVARLRQAAPQLAAGVAALHAAGKLHRDVKPTNLLVTPEGRVVLLDFGLTAELGRTGVHLAPAGEDRVVGTVAYMAPEQAAGQPVSAACDWYGVGVVLFEALTGRLPFEGEPADVVRAKLSREAPRASSVAADVPLELDALCAALLARDPLCRPCDDEVLARLGACGAAADGAVPLRPGADELGASPTLIGRERHLTALRQAFLDARSASPVVVLVSGKPGTGKSSLLDAFLGGLTESGEATVLAGRCFERESVPFNALDGVIDALCRQLTPLPPDHVRRILPWDLGPLARMFPVLNRLRAVPADSEEGVPADPHEARRRAVAALRLLLVRLAEESPLVLAVDDLHWGDAENATLIEDLLRPPGAPRLLLIGAHRGGDAGESPLVEALRRSAELSVRELTLDVLTTSESRAFALALIGRDDAGAMAEAHAVAGESQGNPYFLRELVRQLRSGRGLAADGRPPAAVPCTRPLLDRVLGDRVGRLPPVARRLLEVVAVAARPIALALASRAAGIETDARCAAATLRGERLLRAAGRPHSEEVETYHECVRAVVLAGLSADDRERHHRELARVLEATGEGDEETLAVHYAGAGLAAKAAQHYARAAASAARTLAFDRAARLYRAALSFAEEGPTRAGLRVRLGEALAAGGRGTEAARAFLDAAGETGLSAAERLDARRRAALEWLVGGHVDEGLGVLGGVVRAMGLLLPVGPRTARVAAAWYRMRLRLRGTAPRPRDPLLVTEEERARVDLCWSAGAALSAIDPPLGAVLHRRGLLLALDLGEPGRVARGLALDAALAALRGRTRRGTADAAFERAEAAARGAGAPQPAGLLLLARAFAALTEGNWREVIERTEQAEPVFRALGAGAVWELDTARHLSLLALTSLGEFDALRDRLPGLCRDAAERGDLYAATAFGTYVTAVVRLADDDPAGAERAVAGAMAGWSRRGFHVQHATALRARAAVALYHGDGTAAWQLVRSARRPVRRSGLARVQYLRIHLAELEGRCALAASDASPRDGRLLREATTAAKRLEREGPTWATAHAALLRAGIAAREKEGRDAASLFSAAADLYDALEMLPHAAVARLGAGTLLGGPGGERLVSAAAAVLTALGVRHPRAFAQTLAPLPHAGLEETPSTGDGTTRDRVRAGR